MKRFSRTSIAIYLLYLAVAIIITWPLVQHFSTQFPGFPDGDAHEMTRHIWWFKYALQHGQPLIFQPLLGYPDGIPGVILWSDPLQFFPGWLFAFFMPLPAAYNLFVLLTMALNGWATYWIVSKLIPNSVSSDQSPLRNIHIPAVLAGLVFMAAPTIQGHLAGGHGGVIVQWPLPLLAYYLLRLCGLVETPKTSATPKRFSFLSRDLLFSIIFFFLTPLGHTLQLIYAVLPLIVVIGLTLLIRRDWKAFLRLILVGVIGSALILLLLLPVFKDTFSTSAYTDEGGGVRYSADLLSIVTPSFEHILFGQLDFTHRVLGINIVEGFSYIGIIPALLGLIAIWKRRAARWWLALAVVAWIFSLGPLLKVFDTPLQTIVDGHPTYITLPWALVYNLPGFSLARTPGRFNFVLALGVAVMSGYGASVLQNFLPSLRSGEGHGEGITSSSLTTQHSALKTLPFIFLAALIIFEYKSFWPMPTYSAEIPQAVYDLAKRTDVRAVFDLPWENVLAAKDALWLQTAHEKPMIAGQVTRSTPVSPAKLNILEQTLDPALLNEAGVDVVIVHKHYDATLEATVRAKLGKPFYDDDLIALFNVPHSAASPDWTAVVPAFDAAASHADDDLFVPQSGWISLNGTISAANREVDLSLDNQIIHRWNASSDIPLNFHIPLTASGYHTLSLTVQPPCPQADPVIFECLPWNITGLAFPDFTPQTIAPVAFDHGLQLSAAFVPALTDHTLDLSFLWSFSQPLDDQNVRFVKILDASGQSVAGDDHPLGTFKVGSQWLEDLPLTLPDNLPAGTYTVYVGWYTYPDLKRFTVQSSVPGAPDGWAQIGQFAIPS